MVKVGDSIISILEGLLPNFGSSEAAGAAGSADEPNVLGKRLGMTHITSDKAMAETFHS